MSADIIEFAKRGEPQDNPGNGAREVIAEYFADAVPMLFMSHEDHFLAWLWERGFKVVPVAE